MRSDPYRIFGWLIPILCMMVAAFVVYRQNGALQVAQSQRDAAVRDYAAATEEKASADKLSQEERYAAAVASPDEQTQFLTDLRARAAACGVQIEHWTSQVASYGAGDSATSAVPANPADAADASLLKGITRISSTLSLSGTYPALRKFVGGIVSSKRLLTLNSINWTRGSNTTNLTVNLSRYVAPAQSTAVAGVSSSDNSPLPGVGGTNP